MDNALNIHTRKKEFHIFSSKDFALGELGIASYTKNTLDNYLKSSNPDIADFYGSSQNVDDAKKELLCSDISKISLVKFDKINNQYEYESGTDIFKYVKDDGVTIDKSSSIQNLNNFLTLYDLAITSKNPTVGGQGDSVILREDILAIATKIQTSLSGCLSFSASYTALGILQNVPITLRLLSRENSQDGRVIGLMGSPIIAGIPQTISQLTFGQQNTNSSDIGVYTRPSEGGINNPANSVAGKLDIRYNKSTGMWQSGTHQVLGRLTTDVDSANVGSIDGFTGTNSKDVYDPSSPLYIGQFSVGKALPLSMENGNPYMYGPNYIGCPENGAKKLQELLVVNRSNRTFKRGDVVLLSHIDNEWIIQGFDIPTTNKQTGIGRWQFQKFIVTTEDFFRDNRYKTNNTYNRYIRPLSYEQKMKIKYFDQLMTKDIPIQSGVKTSDKIEAALLSVYIDLEPEAALLKAAMPPSEEYDIELSNKYFQSTIFDQLHSELGGTNNKTVIGRTNISTPKSSDGLIYGRDVPNFWGPAFPNGYTAASVLKLKSLSVGKTITTNNTNTSKFFTAGTPFSITHNTNHIALPHLHSVQGLFRNLEDFADGNLLQLPAEIALNGSFKGKFSYPIEKINIPIDKQNNLPLYFYDNLIDSSRYSYLTFDETPVESEPPVKYDLIGLSPAQPNIIQFSPLQFSMALSMSDITLETSYEYTNLKTEIEYGKTVQISGTPDAKDPFLLFSNSFAERNNLTQIDLFNPRQQGNTIYVGKGYIKFGPYVKNADLEPAPKGGPDLIPKEDMSSEKSNLIGIIAAKNKMSIPPNTTTIFKTTQDFGLSPQLTLAGGQAPLVTTLGSLLSWATGSSDLKNRSIPQWGDPALSDDINSIGTTALHVRMFDQWPDDQTFYDGRYFSVLHFNPSDESVDFTEPTASGQADRLQNQSSVLWNTQLKPESEWYINRIRRGTLVSVGGFRYYKHVVGIDELSIVIAKKSDFEVLPTGVSDETFFGQGYKIGDIISFAGGAKVQITSVGNNGSLVNNGWQVLDKGMGYLPINFYNQEAKRGGVIGDKTDGTGFGGKLMAKNGKVYKKIYIDEGPKERVPITKLTISSGDGKQKATGVLRTQITPNGGNGKYDAFYFMHNDILCSIMQETPFDAGFAQHITLEIGAT